MEKGRTLGKGGGEAAGEIIGVKDWSDHGGDRGGGPKHLESVFFERLAIGDRDREMR